MPRPLGTTTVQILAAIRDGTTYGLDLVARTGLPSGTVYPTLGRLRRNGFIEGRWEDATIAADENRPRRKYYRLTPSGAAALAEGLAHFRTVASALDLGPLPDGS